MTENSWGPKRAAWEELLEEWFDNKRRSVPCPMPDCGGAYYSIDGSACEHDVDEVVSELDSQDKADVERLRLQYALDNPPGPRHARLVEPAGLGTDPAARKAVPLARGVLYYFPHALAAVAALSRVGNEQHNPGEPMHWEYGKSTDHADCLVRHLAESGSVDTDGISHTVKVAWRALALLETELLETHHELMPGKSVRGFTRGGGK
jgi:Domain of unknown function (DUF5664)